MKKKTVILAALLMLCLTVCLFLSSCGHKHDFGDWETKKEATCKKEGRMVRSCECGEEEKKTIEKIDHEFGKWEVEVPATCDEDGEKIRRCECGKEETEVVEKTGHTFGEWEVVEEPACEEDGSRERVCECGETETEVMEKIGHNYEMEVVTEGSLCSGYNEYTCEYCEDSYTEDFTGTVYTATEIYDMYIDSVGEVIVYDRDGYEFALGSCFVYESDTVITNYHVIEDAYSATVTFGDDVYDIESVIAYDKTIDVAVLRVDCDDLPVSHLCEKSHSVGDVVYAIGSSQGLTATFSDGMITTASRELDGVTYVQHDAPISSGNSGGPLINKYGEVIGINKGAYEDSQNLNFAICISELRNLDYSNEMTLEEVCEAESDPYNDMLEYLAYYGEYDYYDSSFYMTVGYDYVDDMEITRSLVYFEGDDCIYLMLDIDSVAFFMLFIDESVSGDYIWVYSDDDYYMEGVIYGSTFTSDSLLSYTDNDISDPGVRTAVRDLASLMADMLISTISTDFYDIGLIPSELGFLHFS